LLVERFDLQPTPWETHVHMDQVIVLYLNAARVQYEAENRQVAQIQLNPGEFVICKRNHPESLRRLDPVSLLCIQIGDIALNEAANSLLSHDNVELRPELRVIDARIRSLFYALEEERASGYPAGALFMDSIEAALAAMLVTGANRIRSRSVPKRGGLPPRRLRRVLEFIHANLDQELTLEKLARTAELSPSHFLHQFRSSMDISPYRYVLALRIERGKRLLADPRLSVLEVGQAVGFENPQHFATAFRRVAGVSPSTYRRHS
jgi:AraC family transcriptional regulator